MKATGIANAMVLTVVFLIIQGCGGGGGGAVPEDVSGNWTGTMIMGNITVPLTAVLTQNDQTVRMDWVGQYPDGEFWGSFNGTYIEGVFTASQQGGTVTLRFSGKSAQGTVVDSGGTATIRLTRS